MVINIVSTSREILEKFIRELRRREITSTTYVKIMSIAYGSILFVRVVGINMSYTMSISNAILKPLAADYDGDTLNILYLYNQDFIRQAERILSPRVMYISRNDGRCNGDMLPARDTIINSNALKGLCEYTEEEIKKIRRLQAMK